MGTVVRAKFVVDFKGETRYGHSTVRLSPVSGGSEENKEFYKWSPAGQIELATINPKAAEAFEVGKEYYVDFIKAD